MGHSLKCRVYRLRCVGEAPWCGDFLAVCWLTKDRLPDGGEGSHVGLGIQQELAVVRDGL